ncbi:MAG: tetratricopeptide repeat protein [Calditrichota bacterium]
MGILPKIILFAVIALAVFSSFASSQTDVKAELEKVAAEINKINAEMQAATDAGDPDKYKELNAQREKLVQRLNELQEAQMTEKAGKDNEIRAKAEFNQGNSLYRAGNYKGALDCYKKSLELDPPNPTAHYMMGVCYQMQKDLGQAKKSYEQALKVDSSFIMALVPLGNIAAGEGNEAEAINYYKKAVEQDSTQFKAFYGLGNVHFKAHRYPEAVQAYQNAVKIDETYADAWIGLGRALQAQEKTSEAIEAFVKGVARDVKSYLGFYLLAECYNAAGQSQKALEAADKALKIKPSYAPASYEKGIALMNLGRKQDAVKALEDAKQDRAWRERAEYFIKKIQGKIP